MFFCPKCKKEVKRSAVKFCPHCGASASPASLTPSHNAKPQKEILDSEDNTLEMEPLDEWSIAQGDETEWMAASCPNCGAQVKAPQRFCRNCGDALNNAIEGTATFSSLPDVQVMRPAEQLPKPSGGLKKIWLAIPLTVVVIGITVTALAYFKGYIYDKQPPEVSISSPAWGKTLTLGSYDPVRESIEVKAKDNRRVTKIDLLLNGVPVKSVEDSRDLTYSWESAREGKYTFYAVVKDGCGNIGKSAPLVIDVKKEMHTPVRESIDLAVSEKEEIVEMVDSWVKTLREKDLYEHMGWYADILEVYYTTPNLSKGDVYKNKEQMMNSFDMIDMSVSDIQVSFENSNTALVTFNKKWDARGKETFSGEVLQRLKLFKSNGKWLITSEEELQIYWVVKNGKKVV